MNKKYILIVVSLLVIFLIIAQLIKPDNKELSYVYEKSNNIEKLKVVYDDSLEKDPKNLELQEKYKDTLELLQDDEYIEYSKEFYKKTKDLKTIKKIITYYKSNKDYENSLIWLEKMYSQTNDEKILKEIIDLTSFTKKTELQKKYLLEQYQKTKETTILFELYNIGYKDFSLNTLFNLAYEKKLDKNDYIKTFRYLIYAKDFEKANLLYFRHNLVELNIKENKDLYIYLNEHYKNTTELKKIYLKLYEKTKDKKYFENLEYFYVDEGEIETFLKLHRKKYEKTKSKNSLDMLIRYSKLNEKTLDYLSYLEIKAINQEDDMIMKTIISEYIDLEEDKKLKSFLDKITRFSHNNDNVRDVLINSYVYLQEYKKAEKIIYSHSPKELEPYLVYSVFQDKINKNNESYFLNALSKKTDENLLKKLFNFKYKNSNLFTQETYKYFNKPNTFKKLNFYTKYFSKKQKEKIYFNFSLKSTDPQFLAQVSQYFLNQNNYIYSKEISKNALSIYPNNKLALKTIALTSLWQKNYNDSLKYLKRLSKIDENNIEVLFYLGQTFELKNKKNTANMYYQKVLDNSDDKKNKFYLISKAKLSNIEKIKNDFEEIIKDSNYNEYLISEYLNLYFEQKYYDKILTLLDKYSQIEKSSSLLQKIRIQTLLAKKDIDNSILLIKDFENKNPLDNDLKYFYQDLANIYFNNNKNKLAYENYIISKKLGLENKALNKQLQHLNKYLNSSIKTSFGIQNDIKKGSIQAEYVDNFRLKVRYDQLEKYGSAKAELSDINENYTLGLGKDYYKLQFNNILNEPLSIYVKKEIDKNSVSTINDQLIYKNYGAKFQTTVLDDLYLSSKIDYFDYENSNLTRLRLENSVYYNFTKRYYVNLSYIYENVKNQNAYGYDDLSYPILALGSNDTISKNLSYNYNTGIEYKNSDYNPFVNINLYYDNKYLSSSLVSSFSKDDLTDKYNYNSMINFSYNFID